MGNKRDPFWHVCGMEGPLGGHNTVAFTSSLAKSSNQGVNTDVADATGTAVNASHDLATLT